MTLDLITLSNMVHVPKNEIAILSTCGHELNLIGEIPAGGLDIMGLQFLSRSIRRFLEVNFGELFCWKVVLLKELVFT